ncbi:unnamed protein product, partial [Staurois parvus]
MLLPGPVVSVMGGPVPPPIAAVQGLDRPHSAHAATFRSPQLLVVSILSKGCWQITGLPLHGAGNRTRNPPPDGSPCTASSCCCQVQACLMGPCTASHAARLHRHTLPCATFRSPHTAGGLSIL